MRVGACRPPRSRRPRADGHLIPDGSWNAHGTVRSALSSRRPRPRSPMIEKLRPDFRGALLLPGEEGYDDTRRVWNGAIDRRPAVIARCAGADDVATAVRFAREQDLAIAVRGGGHAV